MRHFGFPIPAAPLFSTPPRCDQGLAREVHAAQLGHAITVPVASSSSGRAASSGSRSVHGAAAVCSVEAAAWRRSCSSRAASRYCAVRSLASSAAVVAAMASAPCGLCLN
ncbi:hypothetical protein ACFVY1_38245 [Streptomyces sp. NPDC058293]|uniref:hypothetical protein n=1 Tax=Streptomyces sp. NPDC058293 TaxID=3346429 RepID=UPI0036E5F005